MNTQEQKAYGSLAVVCIVWGTTYLALRIGVREFPPFLFSAIRQLSAGTLLLGFLFVMHGKKTFRGINIKRQILPGILMIAIGNGAVGWAERYIPSGLAALIVSAMPVYVVIITHAFGLDRNGLNKRILSGLLLGCIGILLIFRDNIADLADSRYLWGVMLTFIASFSWAAGTVYTKQKETRANPFVNAACQFIVGGLALLVPSALLDDWSELNSISMNSIWALGYLTIFGSILAYGCYLYALKKLPSKFVSAYAYVNPFIAIILGYVILNEKLTWLTGVAFITTLLGIYCIHNGTRISHQSQIKTPKKQVGAERLAEV
jgi:drug/metabolite transporter (DMT)-like permease